jgi:hypothetical protein
MWEPLTTLKASMAYYKDNFTFYLYYFLKVNYMYREQLKDEVKIRAGVPYAKMRKLSFTAYMNFLTIMSYFHSNN